MNERTTPEDKFWDDDELDAVVQKLNPGPKTRVSYMKLRLFLQEHAEEARLEGRLEARNELIKNSFAVGISIETIAKATGLTEAEIAKILADDTQKISEV